MKFIERNLNLIGILLLTGFAAAAAGLYWDVPAKISRTVNAKEAAGRYTCPMHPQIVRTAPGQCPECDMRLVKASAVAPTQTVAAEKGSCCGEKNPTETMSGATCPHMASLTNASLCPGHSHP